MKNEMELRFPATAQNEAFSRMVVSAFVMPLAPTMTEMAEIRTAISEAVTNVVVHAYRGRKKPGDVLIRARLDGNVFSAEIEDTGMGIEDVERAMLPFFTTQQAEERTGIGFALMQSFMDEVNVVSALEKGTKVRLSRRITGMEEAKMPEERTALREAAQSETSG